MIIGGLAIIGMPPFPIFFSKFFILLQLGAVSLWVLLAVLVLLFIAAVALGYFVIIIVYPGIVRRRIPPRSGTVPDPA